MQTNSVDLEAEYSGFHQVRQSHRAWMELGFYRGTVWMLGLLAVGALVRVLGRGYLNVYDQASWPLLIFASGVLGASAQAWFTPRKRIRWELTRSSVRMSSCNAATGTPDAISVDIPWSRVTAVLRAPDVVRILMKGAPFVLWVGLPDDSSKREDVLANLRAWGVTLESSRRRRYLRLFVWAALIVGFIWIYQELKASGAG